jgi:site-specific DNA recombinase
MGKRAAIYTRVSSDEQAENGYSLSSQLDGCRKYAATHDFTVVIELADDCSGSIPIAERPEGGKIYKAIDESQIDAIIMYTQDRTARDERVLEYLLFKDHIYSHGLELHYSDTGLDPYTMEGNLVGYIKAHAASEERKKVRERTMRGKNAKARNNRMVLNGLIPYGYKKIGIGKDAKLEIDEEQAEVVKWVFEWYTRGDGANGPLSMRSIARRLEMLKIPTATGGARWSTTVISGILEKEIYAGRAHYGKRRNRDGKTVAQPREAQISIDVPELAIIDRPTFEIVKNS